MPTQGVIRPPDWKDLYQLAILEMDPAKLPQRIEDARNAVLDRLEGSLSRRDYDEHQELNDALNGLRVLRKECELPVRERPRPTA